MKFPNFKLIAPAVIFVFQSLPSDAQDEMVTIAFREDTPPFSQFLDGEYQGYMADICEEAILRIGDEFEIEKTTVSASDRFRAIDDGDASVLCGPVSITSDRLRDYVFTIPLFVSGISYATVVDQGSISRDPTQARAAVLKNTTAFSGATESLFEEYFGAAGSGIFRNIEALRKTENNTSKETENVLLVESYLEGFQNLCDGSVKFVLGDIDILNSFASESNCEAIVVRRTLTRELYGVLFSPEFVRSDFGMKFFLSFQAAIFDQFQNGFIQRVFSENFEGQVMSNELQNLLRLYVRDLAEQR